MRATAVHLRKISVLMTLAWSESLQYRAETVVWFAWELFPAAVMLLVWAAAFQDQTEIAGLTFPEMATYYTVMLALNALITVHPEHTVMRLVREGTLSPLLLRPFPVPLYLLVQEIAWKGLRIVYLTPTVLVLILLFPGALGPRPADLLGWLLFGLSTVLAFFLCASLKFLVGGCAFWLTEALGMVHVYELLTFLLGGLILPLQTLPDALQALAAALPFRHQYATPVAFFLGHVPPVGAAAILLEQLAWVAALWLLMRFIWQRGLRRYESVGG